VLRYSNPDRIMTLCGPPGNWKWAPVQTSRRCLDKRTELDDRRLILCHAKVGGQKH